MSRSFGPQNLIMTAGLKRPGFFDDRGAGWLKSLRPALNDDFLFRVKINRVTSLAVQVAKEAVLPAGKWEESHGSGNADVDLFGCGFTLLRLGPNAPAAGRIERAAAERGVPLTSVAIVEPKVLEAYERRLVLVRPDGHVAWRADDEPADAGVLIDVLRGQSKEVRQQQLGKTS